MSEESTSSTTETVAPTTSGSELTAAAAAAQVQPATESEGQAEEQTAEPAVEEAKEPEGAPETYEFTLPENITVSPILDKFKEHAKELNLPQDKAQGLVDLYLEGEKMRMEQWDGIQKEWVSSAKNDKEYGGAKYDENIAAVGLMLAKHGTPELNKMLDDYGVGNHPEMIRLLTRLAKATAEDKHVSANAGTQGRSSEQMLDNFYPSMARK